LSSAEQLFRGRLIMAPMSRGTDLPFRRLATEHGAEVCLGEMAYAHKVVRDEGNERVLLRRHPTERCFGVQLAGKHPPVMAEAARVAEQAGADFVDVNLGCPIDDATRRGFGAALLGRPTRVAAIVSAMKAAVSVPVTVKLRLGWSSEKPTFLRIARAAVEAGADAVSLHARSRAQRYRRPADWDRVADLVESMPVPVIGNGDVLSWRDARGRLAESGCAAVMVGRWALAKPWIFEEFASGRDLEPDAPGRLAVLRRYVELCREHFGDDERGRARSRRFFVFHQDFFRRYRRGAGRDAVNAEDPREWGRPPESELERWLCRADREAVAALCDWLIDGKPPRPRGPAAADAPRAVKLASWG
jgi:tRNA-dihydrouridine synthase 3